MYPPNNQNTLISSKTPNILNVEDPRTKATFFFQRQFQLSFRNFFSTSNTSNFCTTPTLTAAPDVTALYSWSFVGRHIFSEKFASPPRPPINNSYSDLWETGLGLNCKNRLCNASHRTCKETSSPSERETRGDFSAIPVTRRYNIALEWKSPTFNKKSLILRFTCCRSIMENGSLHFIPSMVKRWHEIRSS